MNAQKTPMIYFGHHKCASTWIHLILRKLCQKQSFKIEYVHSPRQFSDDLDRFMNLNEIDMLTYANADITYVRKLSEFRGFHVIRDIRDIAVSSYFSHLYSHDTSVWPALVERRKKLQQMSKADGLMRDMKNIRKAVFDRIAGWDYHHPDILELKMEELTRRPYDHFKRILSYLGFPGDSDDTELKSVLPETTFEKLAQGRKPGEVDIHHHYRKGTPGDWRNHFDKVHKQFIKDKYGAFLIEHGYEADLNW